MVINLRRIAAAAGVVILLAVIYLIGVSFLQAGEEKKDAKTEVEAEQPLMEKKEPKVKYTRGFLLNTVWNGNGYGRTGGALKRDA